MSVIEPTPTVTRQCKEGILDTYLKSVCHQESPLDFHIWTCLSLLATSMGRDCYCQMGMWETYPNMYIILVGESAITHKSTAISMGTKLLTVAVPEVEFLGDCMTAQALTSTLSEKSKEVGRAEGFIEGSELSVLLDNSKKDDVFIKRLTDFWDCPSRRKFRTIGRGVEEIKDVCINLLGGSTPKWLRSSIPEESLEGGFFSRLILVQRPPKGEKNPRPMQSREQRAMTEMVKNDLKCIFHNMEGEFVIEATAQNFFDEWYHEHNHPSEAQSFMRGYYGRKGDFMLKLAMCISASYSDDMIVTLDDMATAHKLLNENEKYTKDLVKYMGTTEQGGTNMKVLAKIKKGIINCKESVEDENGKTTTQDVPRRGILHSNLLRGLSHQMRRDELSMVVDTLVESSEIEVRIVGTRSAKAYVYIGDTTRELFQ